LLGHTQYGGAFLLLPQALTWLATARDCFTDPCGTLPRGLLTSIFAPLIGLERLWHLEEMEDLGFALLTGGRRCPSRNTVGGWRRHLPWYEVEAFCRRTSPLRRAVAAYPGRTVQGSRIIPLVWAALAFPCRDGGSAPARSVFEACLAFT
jgi:hypothetical protein